MRREIAKGKWRERVLGLGAALALLPILSLLALLARWRAKPLDIGLGPHPLINNIYHKKALSRFGYRAETFVTKTYYITNAFDQNLADRPWLRLFPARIRAAATAVLAFVRAIFQYRALYLYFNGGPLAIFKDPLRAFEPRLLRLANVKTVVMPYGTDVQDMSLSPNLMFKHAQSLSYPNLRLARTLTARNIDLWTGEADHVLSGVEWVDYMSHWDTLMLGHFSIDTCALEPARADDPFVPGTRPLRVLHAPNHRHIKGSDALLRAVRSLNQKGVKIDLELVERRPNEEVIAAIRGADVIADQLIVGWYAMFAIEAMALGKPVICFLRPDLVEFYAKVGLLDDGPPPMLSADVATIESLLRDIAIGRHDLAAIGAKSREFVVRHHSLESVGRVFDRVNRELGIEPRDMRERNEPEI